MENRIAILKILAWVHDQPHEDPEIFDAISNIRTLLRDPDIENQSQAKAAALESAAGFSKPPEGPIAPGACVFDTLHDSYAFLAGRGDGWAVVHYVDDPDCQMSCGNEPGRWVPA